MYRNSPPSPTFKESYKISKGFRISELILNPKRPNAKSVKAKSRVRKVEISSNERSNRPYSIRI
jgi:hypothetical protein